MALIQPIVIFCFVFTQERNKENNKGHFPILCILVVWQNWVEKGNIKRVEVVGGRSEVLGSRQSSCEEGKGGR
jgi:hypothetical protein